MEKEKQALLSLIDRFSGQKVAVWGDFILDEYLYGNTRRISREAPVLIISYQKKEFSLGGAGNSLLNIQALGGAPLPIGVIGKDEAAEKMLEMLRSLLIPTKYLIRSHNFETPIKTRVLAGEENTRKQQILRIDKESRVPEKAGLKQKIQSSLDAARHNCTALLISDYNYMTVKGDIFKAIAPRWRKAKLPITLDSRFRLLQFCGVTVATPNEPEVQHALKIDFDDNPSLLRYAGQHLLKKLNSSALLITCGSKGMALFEREKPPLFLPVHGTTDIVDVTGAGDTVISIFTLALACGASFRQAATLANYAGGIVVMKKGTATVSPDEIKKAIES